MTQQPPGHTQSVVQNSAVQNAELHQPSASQQPLRVLQIHNFYQQRGGEDVVVENEALLLQQAGVELLTWYVDSSQVQNNRSWRAKLLLLQRLFWNRQAQQQLTAILQVTPVDIIHLHNDFPLLSPAIIHRARQLGVPVVCTIHNFRWCHPAACIQQLADVQRSPWRFLGKAVYRNSRLATVLMLVHIQLHRWLGSYALCQRLICPSQFVAEALRYAGFADSKLLVKPHSVAATIAKDFADTAVETPNGYALYVGRPDAAKGIYFLLKAWQQINHPLVIVGVTEQQVQQWSGYQANPRVHFAGQQSQAALTGFYQQAALLIVPSLVAETFGNVVIEAFCHGTPCLVSDAGALPELVRSGHNHLNTAEQRHCESAGEVFESGNQADFIHKTSRLLQDKPLLAQMSQQAKKRYLAHYMPEQNQQALLECYRQVLVEQGKGIGGK